jgi:hypothetical protein
MTTFRHMRVVLLATSALASASAIHATTAPERTWNIDSISNTATNTKSVTLTGDFGTTAVTADAPTISADSTGGSISGSAVGAVAGSSATLSTQGGGAPDTAVTVTGTTTLTGDNQDTVTADVNVFGANIAGGTSNSISATAVGAVGSLGISTIVDGTGTAPVNSLTYTGAVTVGGTNSAEVTFSGDLGTTGVGGDAPTIAAGTNNGISTAAVGAVGSLSFSGVQTGGSESAETVDFDAEVQVTGTNSAEGAVTANTGIFGAEITDGTGNSISGAAVGATGSVSLSSIVDGTGTAPTTAVTFGSTVAVTGTNNAAVEFNGDLGSSANTATDAPTIANGIGNSISVAGVGASASVSYGGVQSGGSAGEESFTVTGATTITALNNAGGTVDVTSDVYGATITNGTGNGISAAAVGSSASFSVNSVVLDADTAPTTALTFDAINVNSTNSEDVSITGGLLGGATVTSGVNNSISVAGVGASGGTSLSTVAAGTADTAPAETITLGAITTTVLNDGDVDVDGNIGETGADGATIGGGFGNSISIAGVGASGSTSFSQTWSGGSTGGTSYTAGAISTSVTNNASVNVSSSTFAANIGGGVNNSISTAAVGASASTSFSVITR